MIDSIFPSQLSELRDSYSSLEGFQGGDGEWIIEGTLSFSAEYDGQRIKDSFSIKMIVPSNYPENLPVVWETGDRISQDFHSYSNKSLCLGFPNAVREVFLNKPSLLGFVENCLIPYLFAFSYFDKYKKMPFGELSHGGKGVLEYYQEYFQVDEPEKIKIFLQLLVEDSYRGHLSCPCGSKKRLRNCHGQKLIRIKNVRTCSEFKMDFENIWGPTNNRSTLYPHLRLPKIGV